MTNIVRNIRTFSIFISRGTQTLTRLKLPSILLPPVSCAGLLLTEQTSGINLTAVIEQVVAFIIGHNQHIGHCRQLSIAGFVSAFFPESGK